VFGQATLNSGRVMRYPAGGWKRVWQGWGIAGSLAGLEMGGVLPRANRMDIDELLNPGLEREIIAAGASG
jgi:hypothetical protein